MEVRDLQNADELQELYDRVLPYLTIDPNDLGNEIVRHTANYAYLAQELARAKGKAMDKRNDLDYKKAVALIESKAMTYTDGLGKTAGITDTMAKACVDAADVVVDAKKAVVEAEKYLAFWQSVLDSMYQRSYMLTKLADMQQHELMLAGNEYNAGISQDLKHTIRELVPSSKVSDSARQAKREVQLGIIKDSVH